MPLENNPKKIPQLTAIPTPTAWNETDIETVVAKESTYANYKMTLAQIYTLATVSGSIKTALDALSALIATNTSNISTLSTTKLNVVGGTRTGLTADRVLITNASGVETYMSPWSDTEFIWFTSGVPTKKVPDARIAGEIRMWSTNTPPTWWFVCDGTAKSRTTYAALFAVIGTTYWVGDGSTTFNIPDLQGKIAAGRQASISKGTATITIASPAVVTFAGHALATGNKVLFTTTGALPTGLSVNTDYYVTVIDANTFNLSATLGGAFINTSGTQSGTHTLFSSNFNSLGGAGGEVNHTLSVGEMPSHSHTVNANSLAGNAYTWVASSNGSVWGNVTVGATGSSLTHNNLQPYVTLNYIIAF